MNKLRKYITNKLAFIVRRLLSRAEYFESRQIIREFGSFGEKSIINGRINVIGPERIFIGRNVHIGHNAWMNGEGGIRIGDNTHISRNLVIYSVNHNYEGKRLPYDEKLIKEPVSIGRNVWIGMNVSIAPGTTIGDGAIIGMGSVVSGEVEPMAIVASPRAEKVSERDKEHYKKLEKEGKYGGAWGLPLEDEIED